MPRAFDMVADYSSSVDQVHAAFCDKDYWLARLAASGADISTLDSVVDDGAGGLDFSATQTMRAPGLPAVVTQLHHGDLSAVREEHWGPVVSGQALGTIRAYVKGAPLNVSGSAVLSPFGDGARLQVTASVEVRIPLLGGKVESMVGQHMKNLLGLEKKFTDEWIANGGH